MRMVAQIGRAIDDDLFRLYRKKIVGLQPHTALQNKYEILLRMIDKGGILPLGAFLPVAERYSFMKAVDRWVIRTSSFAYLKHLPVQYIKIDGGFVKDMVRNKVDHAIVDGITRISRAMNIQTIAEYVENEERDGAPGGIGWGLCPRVRSRQARSCRHPVNAGVRYRMARH